MTDLLRAFSAKPIFDIEGLKYEPSDVLPTFLSEAEAVPERGRGDGCSTQVNHSTTTQVLSARVPESRITCRSMVADTGVSWAHFLPNSLSPQIDGGIAGCRRVPSLDLGAPQNPERATQTALQRLPGAILRTIAAEPQTYHT